MVKRTGLQTNINVIFKDAPVPGKNHEKSSASANSPVPIPKSRDVVQTKTFPVEEPISKSLKRDKPSGAGLFATRLGNRGVSSKRRKTSIVLVFVLLIALVFLFVRNFFGLQENSINSGIVVSEQAKTAISLKQVEINWPVPPVYPKDIRDPMELTKVEMPEISMGLIVSINNKLSVVIDGQILSEGDIITGASVVKVNSDYVEFMANERSWKQKMPRLVVKGIVHSDEIPLAVVGIDTVKGGDIVMGVTVVKINQNSVEFAIGERKWIQEVEGKE